MSLTTQGFRRSVLCNDSAQERRVVRWFFRWCLQCFAGWALDAGAAGAPTPTGDRDASAERVSRRVGAAAVTPVWEAGLSVRGRGPAWALPVLVDAQVRSSTAGLCAGASGRSGARAGGAEREGSRRSGRDLRDQPGIAHPPGAGVGPDAGDGGGRGPGCPGGEHARGRCPRRPPRAKDRRSGARGSGASETSARGSGVRARTVPGGGGARNAGRVSVGIGHVGGRS